MNYRFHPTKTITLTFTSGNTVTLGIDEEDTVLSLKEYIWKKKLNGLTAGYGRIVLSLLGTSLEDERYDLYENTPNDVISVTIKDLIIGPDVDLRGENFEGADLTGANLTNANLLGANLSGANLSGANLTNANLTEANLREANLTEANLREANLTNANLPSANLTEANLPNANLTDAALTSSTLTEANLTDANLYRANLTDANLEGTVLTNARLSEADLSGTNLRGARLSGANLEEANLEEANLSEAYLEWANLSSANLSSANLSSANLSSVDLSSANLYRANLSSANLTNAVLSDANLEEADLTGSDLTGSNIKDASFIGANLSDTNFSRAELSRTNLSKANLSRAVLENARLIDANLSEANLSSANIEGALLINANLSGADFYGANLTYADLSSANLSSANFDGANLSSANFDGANIEGTILLDQDGDLFYKALLLFNAKKGDHARIDEILKQIPESDRKRVLKKLALDEAIKHNKAGPTIDLLVEDRRAIRMVLRRFDIESIDRRNLLTQNPPRFPSTEEKCKKAFDMIMHDDVDIIKYLNVEDDFEGDDDEKRNELEKRAVFFIGETPNELKPLTMSLDQLLHNLHNSIYTSDCLKNENGQYYSNAMGSRVKDAIFQFQTTSRYNVYLRNLIDVLGGDERVFYILPLMDENGERIVVERVASVGNVGVENPLGDIQANYVSADHCQGDTERRMYGIYVCEGQGDNPLYPVCSD